MPADDYAPAATGALKLKGAHLSSKISKHQKKKRPKPPPPDSDKLSLSSTTDPTSTKSSHDKITEDFNSPAAEEEHQHSRTNSEDRQTPTTQRVKTEAELRYEERRRKRVCIPFLSFFLPSPSSPFSPFTFPTLMLFLLIGVEFSPNSSMNGSSARASRRTRSGWRS